MDIAELLALLLDRQLGQLTLPVDQFLLAQRRNGILAVRLTQLQERAEALQADGKRLQATDPVLRALRADLATLTASTAQLVDNNAEAVVRQALGVSGDFVQQTSFGTTDAAALARIGIAFNRVSPDTIVSLVQYIESAEWRAELQQFGPRIDNVVNNIALKGLLEGWGPLRTARELTRTVEVLPIAQANQMMRTLQINSFRDGVAVQQLANADILADFSIRIAALDGRTCMACIALHGTRIPLGEKPPDHRNGRCTSVTPVKGQQINVQTGEEWLQTPQGQRRLAQQPGVMNALGAGAVTLQDFVKPGTDAVFGDVVTEASLKGVLGEQAERFYARNQT